MVSTKIVKNAVNNDKIILMKDGGYITRNKIGYIIRHYPNGGWEEVDNLQEILSKVSRIM